MYWAKDRRTVNTTTEASMTDRNLLSPDAAVYGVIMNDRASRDRLAEAAARPPYKASPQAPVLYLKPRNTWMRAADMIVLPQGADQVEIGAVVGLRMGRDAARLHLDTALDAADACLLAADMSLPHADYYRPAIREKSFDGSLPLALLAGVTPGDVSTLILRTWVGDQLVAERSLDDLIRGPAQLLADVSEFMTLRRGDVLLLGVVYQSPLARVGSRVRVEIPGLAQLAFTVTAKETSA